MAIVSSAYHYAMGGSKGTCGFLCDGSQQTKINPLV